MSTSQSIQGLIKWSQRGEWRDNFETALERHVGPACRSAGIGLDALAEIIGDHWMSTLWGCVFEDLVSAGRAERNVADDYLKRRGWKESAGTRAYIEALRRSSMSLYEVSDIVGGVSFLARDLVRGGDPGAGWVPHLAPPRRSRRPCGPDASALVTALESHI